MASIQEEKGWYPQLDADGSQKKSSGSIWRRSFFLRVLGVLYDMRILVLPRTMLLESFVCKLHGTHKLICERICTTQGKEGCLSPSLG